MSKKGMILLSSTLIIFKEREESINKYVAFLFSLSLLDFYMHICFHVFIVITRLFY